eukprot:m51a1_g3581 hypothetical protein (279) ;mRNA; f:1122964-1125143
MLLTLLVAGLAGLVTGFEGVAYNALVLSAACTSGPALAALARVIVLGGTSRAVCAAAGVALVAVLDAGAAFALVLFDGMGFRGGIALQYPVPDRRVVTATVLRVDQTDEMSVDDDGYDEDAICELAGQIEVLAERDLAELQAQRRAKAAALARADALERALARAEAPTHARATTAKDEQLGELQRRLEQREAEAVAAEAAAVSRAEVLEAALAECHGRAERAEETARAAEQQLGEAAVAQLYAERQAALAAIAQLETHLVAATAASPVPLEAPTISML